MVTDCIAAHRPISSLAQSGPFRSASAPGCRITARLCSPQHEGVGHVLGQVDPDTFRLQLLVHCGLAVLPPDAALLGAAERRHEADRPVGVDPGLTHEAYLS